MLVRRATNRRRSRVRGGGSGATIRGNEPLQKAEPADAELAPLVLVVDDVDDNRDLYATYFAYAGFRVEQAADGNEALSMVATRKPDIVIMDLAMPHMDGWEATRLIKTNPRTQHIAVLVITGHATMHDLDRARAMGADDLCTKPCLPKDLLERVRKLLSIRLPLPGGAQA